MTEIEYHQSDRFAVPVRDYSEMFVDETILVLDKRQEFMFLKPEKFEGLTILDVSEQINAIADDIANQRFKVIAVGKRPSLQLSTQFEKAPSLCWKAELVIVGLR